MLTFRAARRFPDPSRRRAKRNRGEKSKSGAGQQLYDETRYGFCEHLKSTPRRHTARARHGTRAVRTPIATYCASSFSGSFSHAHDVFNVRSGGFATRALAGRCGTSLLCPSPARARGAGGQWTGATAWAQWRRPLPPLPHHPMLCQEPQDDPSIACAALAASTSWSCRPKRAVRGIPPIIGKRGWGEECAALVRKSCGWVCGQNAKYAKYSLLKSWEEALATLSGTKPYARKFWCSEGLS